MIDPEKRKAIFLLSEEGMNVREIARRLGVGRNTVRSAIASMGIAPPAARKSKIRIDRELLQRLYDECDGWKRRIHEKLSEEEKIEVKYSTLTRMLRELGIGPAGKQRCDRVPDEPGAEMQHDTSPYTVKLGGRPTRVIASMMYLRYSKRRYLKFYLNFNRFSMKCFIHEALMHWGRAAAVCIIDNTNLARLRGLGRNAVIVPEMEAFARRHGYRFVCHERGHSNRKAGEERSFWTVETNFIPGRKFEDIEDMNAQALEWATVRMHHRPVAKTGLIPAKAFEHERAFLVELSPFLPPPYIPHDRPTDQYGYISFDGNYFWVPGTSRDQIRALEYSDLLKLYRGRDFLIEYRLPAAGVKNKLIYPDGMPRPIHEPKNRRKPTDEEETRLREMGEGVGAYLDFALKPQGNERHRLVRDLYRLSRQMTPALFTRTVQRALKYGITDIKVIRRIALLYLNAGVETLPQTDVDEDLESRETYIEGRLTDMPDFSVYDELLEEDDG